MLNNPFHIKQIKNQSGFTLVELIIVIALIAILMSVAVPRLPMSSHRQLELAASRLASDLRLIRSEAIASGVKCKITFFTNEKYYIVTLADGSDRVDLPEEITSFTTNIITKDEDHDKNPYTHFTELGTIYGSGTITLQTKDKETRSIIIAPVYGRVKIE